MIDSILISNGKPQEYPAINDILRQHGFLELQTCERCFARANYAQLLASDSTREKIKIALYAGVGKHLKIEFVDGDKNSYIQDNIS